MTRRRWLLRCYPRAWRECYGDDVLAYLQDTYGPHLPVGAALSLVGGGLRERAHGVRLGSSGDSADDRLRGGVLYVLVAWALLVVAGCGFAKMSEQFDATLPGGHAMANDSYALVEVTAVLGGLVVLVGVVVALPAFLRLLATDGWSAVRRHIVRASVATTMTTVATVGLVGWAQHLTFVQRNGTDSVYAAAFLAWVGLVVTAIALWTIAAVAVGGRLTLSRPLLLTEGALAGVVALAVLVITAAGLVWMVAMSASGSTFYVADGPVPQLVVIGTVMLAVLAVTVAGVRQIGCAAPAVIRALRDP